MKPFRSIQSIRSEAMFREDARKGDVARGAFLRALDDSEFAVDDWEAEFINSFLDFTSNRPGDEPRWWSEGRRRSADRMARKYPDVGGAIALASRGSSVASPHLGSSVASPHLGALGLPHSAGHCDYLVRGDDRVQRRCGRPAVKQLRAGLELCAEHEGERQKGIARIRDLKARQLR